MITSGRLALVPVQQHVLGQRWTNMRAKVDPGVSEAGDVRTGIAGEIGEEAWSLAP
jgi:hypothetical protein